MGICQKMDVDDTGTLQIDELVTAYFNESDFRQTMELLKIEPKDLMDVHRLLDDQKTGTVNHQQFCQLVCQMQNRDPKASLMFVQLQLAECKNFLAEGTKHRSELADFM